MQQSSFLGRTASNAASAHKGASNMGMGRSFVFGAGASTLQGMGSGEVSRGAHTMQGEASRGAADAGGAASRPGGGQSGAGPTSFAGLKSALARTGSGGLPAGGRPQHQAAGGGDKASLFGLLGASELSMARQ